ncbi:hypothetical protein BX257_1341 [Streptomyces sp. 3212.3]|jgi:hypothetical protein|nr:hypothetical protein BX257_1341 [Streptomyces sp. 3212.3]
MLKTVNGCCWGFSGLEGSPWVAACCSAGWICSATGISHVALVALPWAGRRGAGHRGTHPVAGRRLVVADRHRGARRAAGPAVVVAPYATQRPPGPHPRRQRRRRGRPTQRPHAEGRPWKMRKPWTGSRGNSPADGPPYCSHRTRAAAVGGSRGSGVDSGTTETGNTRTRTGLGRPGAHPVEGPTPGSPPPRPTDRLRTPGPKPPTHDSWNPNVLAHGGPNEQHAAWRTRVADGVLEDTGLDCRRHHPENPGRWGTPFADAATTGSGLVRRGRHVPLFGRRDIEHRHSVSRRSQETTRIRHGSFPGGIPEWSFS